MNCFFATLGLVLLASLALAAPAETPPETLPPLPTYDCHQVAQPPTLDGVLDDPCWQGVPEIHLARCVSGADPDQATTVKAVWHGNYIYFAWAVSETNIQDHNKKRDDAVFSEACVEHFLQAPGGFPATPGAPNRYCEVDLSPTGVIWDGRIVNPYGFPPVYSPGVKMVGDTSWSPADTKCASVINGTVNNDTDKDVGWTMEVQIPLDGPPGGKTPQIGEVWRMNLYRIHGWNQPDRELQSWSLVGLPSFHVPQRFGYLRFVGPVAH
jgi:hypothetical protein